MSALTLRSIRWSLCLLVVLTLLTSVGCKQRFTVRGEPTQSFPTPWSHMPQSSDLRVARAKTSSSVVPREAPHSKELERVAVLELINRAPNLVSKDEVSYLTNELRVVASYLPKRSYLVLTKESLEVLIDPSLKLDDCVGSCEVKLGRLVGAKWIITGEVMRFGESLRVSLKLHQTETGQFLKGASLKGDKVEDLEESLHQSALSLMKSISSPWAKQLNEVAPGDLRKQLEHLKANSL